MTVDLPIAVSKSDGPGTESSVDGPETDDGLGSVGSTSGFISILDRLGTGVTSRLNRPGTFIVSETSMDRPGSSPMLT